MKTQFRASQQLSVSLLNEFTLLAEKYNCWDQIYFGEVTYRKFLETLEHSHKEDFSEEEYQRLSWEGAAKKHIASHLSVVKSQHERLLGLQAEIRKKEEELGA